MPNYERIAALTAAMDARASAHLEGIFARYPGGVDNAELNALSAHRDTPCVHCGRKWPWTVLNIEGMIHHGEKPRCLDTYTCARLARREGKR